MTVAVVTGSAKRVGKAIALELAAAGMDVVVHARFSVDDLARLEQEIRSMGRKCWSIVADFAVPEGQEAFVTAVLSHTAVVDVLVHNASLYGPASFQNVTREQFDTMLTVNLTAPMFITQGLLSALQKSPNPSVIHLGDSATVRPYARHAAYFASKAGLDALTRTLAVELAPKIRVNAVAPGTVLFPEDMSVSMRESITQAIPMKRVGTASDIAHAVRYLALEATFVTGQTIAVDGGRSVKP